VSTVLELSAPQTSTLGARIAAAARSAVYIAVGIPLGAVELVVLVPALLLWPSVTWHLAELERTLANRVLLARIPALPVRPALARRRGVAPVERAQIGFLAVRLPTAALALAVAGAPAPRT
jgi:hypothetical protein